MRHAYGVKWLIKLLLCLLLLTSLRVWQGSYSQATQPIHITVVGWTPSWIETPHGETRWALDACFLLLTFLDSIRLITLSLLDVFIKIKGCIDSQLCGFPWVLWNISGNLLLLFRYWRMPDRFQHLRTFMYRLRGKLSLFMWRWLHTWHLRQNDLPR